MALLKALMKTVSMASRKGAQEAVGSAGHVTGHFAKNVNGGMHFVNEYTKAVKPAMKAAKATNPKIGQYHAALTSALGTERFAQIHGALATDKSMSASDVQSLAKQFSYASAGSKKAALQKIMARHTSLELSKAKSAATAGRIAG